MKDRRDPGIGKDAGALYIKEAGETGIYGALWDLGEECETGLIVSHSEINIKQETIEISDIFGLDPYNMDSSGAFLFLAERGFSLVRALREKGIEAAVIGETTDKRDRIIIKDERRRFLTPSGRN